MNTRQITAELLRAGPRHNQLLSPLTQYLGVCGDSPAGIVLLPYEHAVFKRRLGELRYSVSADDDPGRRRGILHQTGAEIAAILGAIPGLAGALSGDRGRPNILTHLRLVLSASELALLPFELSKVPVGAGTSPDSWLALQAHAPVCITRHNRSIRSEGVHWLTRPRILFVSGREVPFEQHKEALLKAIEPWVGKVDPQEDLEGEDSLVKDWLTILEDASLEEVAHACAGTAYTHVHILAHGAEDPDVAEAFGLSLKGEVVSGERLATALLSVLSGTVHRPTVVTLATCDSGQEGPVITPVASIAHDLHASGIALVVASQFPLSIEGSVPFVETFYAEQLLGDHPLISLYKVRLDLHSRFSQHYHDWASLVVYEALPSTLPDQLQALKYEQTNLALKAALKRVETAVAHDASLSEEAYQRLLADVARALDWLPREGLYATECIGLKAAASKRLAEVAYRLATASTISEEQRKRHLTDCHTRLEEALLSYRKAVKPFLVNVGEAIHRKASMHWVLCQALAMEVVLGRPFDEEAWMAARLSARMSLEHAEMGERGWAHGTLAELWLLRLADPNLTEAQREAAARETVEHINTVVGLCGRSSFPVHSTGRQFNRYVAWWGDPAFAAALEAFGVSSQDHWRGENGLLATAKKIVDSLQVKSLGKPLAKPSKHAAKPNKPPAKPEEATTPATGKKASARKASVRGAAPKPDRPPSEGLRFDIEMFPSEHGDCLWVEYGRAASPRRILIDCGAKSAAEVLKSRINKLPDDQRSFELFVLTHIDADHISGVLPFFEDRSLQVQFEDIWFNGWQQLPRHLLGVRQGEEFSKLLEERQLPWNRCVTTERDERPCPIMVPEEGKLPSFSLGGGMTLTLLSPGRKELGMLARKWLKGLEELEKGEFLGRKQPPKPVTDFERFSLEKLVAQPPKKDSSVANGSSIAMLAEFDGRAALLVGDAHAEVVASSIRTLLAQRGLEGGRLPLDALKLSHHGSKNGLTSELLELIDCPRYLVSTNGNRFYHPDREAIARVILEGKTQAGKTPTLYFNYQSTYNEIWGREELKQRYGYQTQYPEGDQSGLRVRL